MNENTQKLIEQLAQKLGTTSEYLWKVLIKQAYVDAWTTIFQYVLIAVFGIVLYKLHEKFSFEPNGKDYGSLYDEKEYLGFIMSILFINFVVLCVVAFFTISNVINGFFNPEYWALNKILEVIGQ